MMHIHTLKSALLRRCVALICCGCGFGLISQAMGYPAIGDKVTWSGELQQSDGFIHKVQITKEVLAFDKDKKLWTIKVEALLGTQKTSEVFEIENLYSPEQYKDLMSKCVSKQGILEELHLDVGTYKTCKLSSTTPGGTRVEKWWGDLPFGIVSKTTLERESIDHHAPDIRTVLIGL